LNDAAVAHSYVVIYGYFLKEVNKITDKNVKAVLTNLLLLYGIDKILERSSKFYETSTLKPDAYAILFNRRLSLFN